MLSLVNLPAELIEFALAPALDQASVSCLAMASKSFYAILKFKILDIEYFTLECARYGFVSLMQFAMAELRMDPSTTFSPLCAREAILNRHFPVLAFLLKHIHCLIGRLYKYNYDFLDYTAQDVLYNTGRADIRQAGQIEVVLGVAGRLDFLEEILRLGHSVDFFSLAVGFTYSGKFIELSEKYSMEPEWNRDDWTNDWTSKEALICVACEGGQRDLYDYLVLEYPHAESNTLMLSCKYFAIKGGHFELAKHFTHENPFVLGDVAAALKAGQLETAKQIVLDSPHILLAAGPDLTNLLFGNLECVKWALERFSFGEKVFSSRILSLLLSKYGHLEGLQYLLSKGMVTSGADFLDNVVTSNRLDIFKYLDERTPGFESIVSTSKKFDFLATALRNQSRDMVKYLLSRGFTFKPGHFLNAIKCRNIPFMKWVLKRGCPVQMDDYQFVGASLDPNYITDVIHLLRDHNAPFDYRVFRYFAESNDIPMMKHLVWADCGIDSRVFTFAPDVRNEPAVEWLHKQYILLNPKDFKKMKDGKTILAKHLELEKKYKMH